MSARHTHEGAGAGGAAEAPAGRGEPARVSEEMLRMIAGAAEAFAQPDANRSRRSRDEHQGFDPAVWEDMARQGWLSIMPGEDQGGLGLGLSAASAIAERLGYAGYFEPFVDAGVMSIHCLSLCEDGTAADLRERAMAGETLLAVAWQAENGGLAPETRAVGARRAGDEWLLSGRCRHVAPARAETFIVAAHDGETARLFAIGRDAVGLTIETESGADGVALARLTLNGLRVPSSAQLHCRAPVSAVMDQALCLATVACAAEMLGAMRRALDLTVEYLGMRRQFGRRIGSFQVLQHRAVDMWLQKELAAAALRVALDQAAGGDAGEAALQRAASSVKARASQAARHIAGQAIQLHGAIGITDEYELGVYVNRILALASRYGTATEHRRRFGRLVPVQER